MKKINRFSLDMEAVAPASEATHAPLLVDGVRTPYKLEGVRLVDQYEMNGGYLIFTDCDCPYEELTFVTLLDERFKPVHSKMLGKCVYVFPSRTFTVQRIDIEDGALLVHPYSPDEGRYRVVVADVWTWRGRRLGVKAAWTPT